MINAFGLKNWPSSPLIFTLITLPIYLIGSFGLRIIGFPSIIRTLFHPDRAGSLRFVLAIFVVLGIVITLTCRIVPVGYAHPYNNSVWFLAQSKYVGWIFAAEVLQVLYGTIMALGVVRLLASSGIVALAILLSAPSTIQHFVLERHPYPIYGKAVMASSSTYSVKALQSMKFLTHNAQPGDVVLPSETLLSTVLALTKCHVPVGYFATYLVSRKDFLQREMAQREFWKDWRKGKVDDGLLREANVNYLIVDNKVEGIPKIPTPLLQEVFSNSEYTIFKVRERL